MATISAILFDKDGTLFDFNKTWANWSRQFLVELAGHNISVARRLAQAVDFDFDLLSFRQGSVLVSDTPNDIARALLPFLPGASMAAIVTRMSALTANVVQAEATPLVPLMGELSARGLSLGVVTNDAEVPARAHLRASGVHDTFRHVIGCDSGFPPKPRPDMLLAFSEMTGIEPRRIVMVGDSAHDMQAAKEAGMMRVAVLTGAATRAQLTPISDVVLPSIAALPRWLDASSLSVTAA